MVSDTTPLTLNLSAVDLPIGDLRQDLKIYSGPSDPNNGPTWSLHDPINNRFFRLQWLERSILNHWKLGSSQKIIAAVQQDSGLSVSLAQVATMHNFLIKNNLLTASEQQDVQFLLKQSQQSKQSSLKWLLHHYLFFKIPLWHPDKFLQSAIPWVAFIYTRTFMVILAIAGFAGLYLTARQWDSFGATFDYFFTAEGVMWYMLALVFVKVIHELGHGITASYFGCRIPTMGVAFMVLFPILYTDTSEVWKLSSRRSRLAVALSGVGAELIIAVFATLLWNFMPEGAGRNGVVMLATVTWITSLAINLNPWMRFDGYYLLADYLAMDNLQERAFALGRWQLREWLLGLNAPPPEYFRPRRKAVLLIYAYTTWIYRLLLFLGIALLVYHLLFKLLGIFLMLVELIWFIVRPIYRELGEWWVRKAELHWNIRSISTITAIVVLAVVLLIPWQNSVEIPAILKAKMQVELYPPTPSILQNIAVKRGQTVNAGELLATLSSPDLEHDLTKANNRIADLKWKINHATSSRSLLENSSVMQKEMVTLFTKKDGLLEQKAKLNLTAPFAGVVTDIKKGLTPGRWLGKTEAILVLIDNGPPQIQGFISLAAQKRVIPNSLGTFQPKDPSKPPITVRLLNLDPVAIQYLEQPYFASIFGGPIGVWEDEKGRFIPLSPIYRLTLDSVEPLGKITFETPGELQLQAENEALFQQLWRQIAQVFIRESSF
ncbi:MAG: biotin/lipoyl-binding protein [Magnetococcales bacterium]|nr:biotin/lipoyl-binding protein [Magnetococcales bacterium]